MLSETYHHLRQGQLSERSTKPPSCEARVPAGGSNVDIKLTAIFSKLKAFHEIVEIALEHVFDIPEKAKTTSPQTHVMFSIVIEEWFINKNLSNFFTYPKYQQNLQPPPLFPLQTLPSRTFPKPLLGLVVEMISGLGALPEMRMWPVLGWTLGSLSFRLEGELVKNCLAWNRRLVRKEKRYFGGKLYH